MTLSTSERRRLLLPRLIQLTGEARDICFLTGSGEPRRRGAFGALRRFNVLRRCVLAALPPALSRRLIASPEAQDRAS